MPRSEVQVLVRAIDKATKDLSNINKELDKLEGGGKDAGRGIAGLDLDLGSMLSTIGMVTAGVAAVGVTMKKAFDLGKEGASILQTTQSFNEMLERTKVAPDLLGKMQVATRDTVDELTLMKGTLALVAGATGEEEAALAAAIPRIAEMAKAANKLNPLLGTTAFQFESLAIAAKRQSIMIADNAGLTIKMENATRELRPELAGLADNYEDLTNQQKFLNEMLVQGDTLINQVGGSVDSLEDDFARLETELATISNEIKKKLAPALANAAAGLVLLLTWSEKIDKALFDQKKRLDLSTLSYGEYKEAMTGATEAAGYLIDEQGNLIEKTGDLIVENFLLDESQRDVLRSMNDQVIATEEVERSFRTAGTEAAILAMNLYKTLRAAEATEVIISGLTATTVTGEGWFQKYSKAIEVTGDEAKKAEGKTTSFLDSIDRDIESAIANLRADLEWFIATGGQFEEAFALLEAGLKGLVITPEEGVVFSYEILLALADVQAEMDGISPQTAAEEFVKQYGGSVDDVRASIDGTDSLQSALNKLEQTKWEIDIIINYTGAIPDIPGLILPDIDQLPQQRPSPIDRPSPGPGGPGFVPPSGQTPLGGVSITFPNAIFGNQMDAEEMAFLIAERLLVR